MMVLLGIAMATWMALSVLATCCYCSAARTRRRRWESERRALGIVGPGAGHTQHYGLPHGRRSSLGARTRPAGRVTPFTHSAASARMPTHLGRRRSHEGVDDREPVRRLPSTGF